MPIYVDLKLCAPL